MTSGATFPDEAGFVGTKRRVIPVTRKLLADGETPVGVYTKLAGGPGTFLLESAEQGVAWSRYSFIGVRSAATLVERDGQAEWLGTPPEGVPLGGDPVAALRETVAALTGGAQPPTFPRSPAAWSAISATTWCAASSGCPPPRPTTCRCRNWA